MRGRGWAVSLAVAAWAVVVVGGGSAQAVPVVDPLPAPPGGDVRFDWDAARAQMRSRQAASRLPGTPLSGATRGGSIGTRIAGTSRSVVQSFETGTASVTTTAAGTASKFGTVVRGAGTVLTAAFALDLTYTAFTGGYGDGFGYAGLIGFQSEGLVCDLTNLVAGSGCAVTGAEGYIANSDVTATPPGWAPDDTLTTSGVQGSWASGTTLRLAVASVPDFGVGGTVTVTATRSGTCVANANAGPNVSWQAVYRTASGRTAIGGSSQLNTWPNYCLTPPTATRTYTVPATIALNTPSETAFFDGFRFWNQYDPIAWQATAAGQAFYYTVGSPVRPAGQEANPVRWFRTDWLCEAGGVSTSHSADSAEFRELDAEWAEPVTPTCDPGALTQVTVSEMGTGLDTSVLYEWTLPVELSAWAEAYPECTGGGCMLELHYLDPASGTRLACFDNPELCLGWFEAPLKLDTFVCTYGSHDVALAECNMYAPTFDPAKWPASGKAPYADPETGEAGPAPVADPLPAPTNGCPPPFTWTSLVTPWWYYKGTLCALEAAFVPPAGLVQSEVGATSEILSARPPWSLVGPIGAVFTGLGDGWSTGCSVLADFDPYGHGLRIPCDPPQSAWMTVLRALGTFVVVVGTGFGVWHMVVAAIGGRAADS